MTVVHGPGRTHTSTPAEGGGELGAEEVGPGAFPVGGGGTTGEPWPVGGGVPLPPGVGEGGGADRDEAGGEAAPGVDVDGDEAGGVDPGMDVDGCERGVVAVTWVATRSAAVAAHKTLTSR